MHSKRKIVDSKYKLPNCKHKNCLRFYINQNIELAISLQLIVRNLSGSLKTDHLTGLVSTKLFNLSVSNLHKENHRQTNQNLKRVHRKESSFVTVEKQKHPFYSTFAGIQISCFLHAYQANTFFKATHKAIHTIDKVRRSINS
jgi:hypothetical protein